MLVYRRVVQLDDEWDEESFRRSWMAMEHWLGPFWKILKSLFPTEYGDFLFLCGFYQRATHIQKAGVLIMHSVGILWDECWLRVFDITKVFFRSPALGCWWEAWNPHFGFPSRPLKEDTPSHLFLFLCGRRKMKSRPLSRFIVSWVITMNQSELFGCFQK